MDSFQPPVSTDPSIKIGEAVPTEAHIPGVEEHRITIDGVRWRYLRAGSGPVMLLIHGLLGYSWSWRFNMRELAQNFTVIAPDLPGCGFSQRGDCLSGTLESDANGLISLMDALHVGEFNVIGSSRGGGVATVLAGLLAKRGLLHRLPRMILSAPINPWSRFGQRRVRWFATSMGRRYVIHVAPRVPSILKIYYRKLYGDRSRIAEGSVAGYAAGLQVPQTFHHLARIMRVWRDDLRQIESSLPLLCALPTLLLWGSRDAAVHPASAYDLQDRLPNSAVLMMDGIGHMPYEEVPAEFNHIVCEFLLRHNPPTRLEIPTSNVAGFSARPATISADRDRRQTHSIG